MKPEEATAKYRDILEFNIKDNNIPLSKFLKVSDFNPKKLEVIKISQELTKSLCKAHYKGYKFKVLENLGTVILIELMKGNAIELIDMCISLNFKGEITVLRNDLLKFSYKEKKV